MVLKNIITALLGEITFSKEESKTADVILGRALQRYNVSESVLRYRNQICDQGIAGVKNGFSVLGDVYFLTNYQLNLHQNRPEVLQSLEARDLIGGLVWNRFISKEEPVALAELVLFSSFGSDIQLVHDTERIPYVDTFRRLQQEGFIRPWKSLLYLHKSIDQYLED